MRLRGSFERDFIKALDKFPKFSQAWFEKYKVWIISGDLDICNQSGDYWGTFEISIAVPHTYPYCVPVVREVSNKIPRNEDRHISKEGLCCLDIDHNLLYMSKKGISITDFIKDKVYPYFANQLYYNETGEYAKGEFKHRFHGIAQFYQEELGIQTPKLAITILESILSANIPGRNDICLCGIGKFKTCHLDSIEFLKSLGKERLREDLDGFLKF